MANTRMHVFYSGQVQGVGFRYTARDIALSLNITGWVKNLPDGRVEIVCEGEEENLKYFLDRISGGFLKHYIVNINVKIEDLAEEFNSFEIRF